MVSLAALIHFENLIWCKKLLADARIPDGQRQTLLRLLREEETKDLVPVRVPSQRETLRD